ncbi:4'-phosphopantetheinyl transferase superfamily protein [Streptomyces sp. NPDC089799]|uniref:4'-phosphopantetheinyl transferase family protein n=1 Tax=Streptomyces sp. NPDC089799 TaxID=3155066 RepID=UPI0034155E97
MVIAGLLPAPVAAWESSGTHPEFVPHPAEAASLRSTAPARRGEFATGRYCAHRALERLGTPTASIPAGERGGPRWPRAVVGSITHCRGYTAAAVARRGEIAALGIDAEPHLPLAADVLEFVAGPGERAHVAELLARRPDVCWDRLLFSAKESVYKAWFPATGRFLGFLGAEVRFDPAAGTFRADVPDAVPAGGRAPGGPAPGGSPLPARLTGRWRVAGEVLLTAVAVPAPYAETIPAAAAAVPDSPEGERE